MKNITVSVDDETYEHARQWAYKRGTTNSAIVKCILVSLPLRSPSAPPPSPTPSKPSSLAGTSIQASASQPSPPSAASPDVSLDAILIPAHGLAVLRTTLQYARQLRAKQPSPRQSTPAHPGNSRAHFDLNKL